MLNILRKSLLSFGVYERNQLRDIHFNKFFISGLILRLIFVVIVNPDIHINLFIPFVKNFINDFSFDPWTDFLENGGDPKSFPYGFTMLFGYFPLTAIGNQLGSFFNNNYFYEYGFKLSSFLYDYFSLILLSFLTRNKANTLLIISYWLSPIVIYTTYIHGQIDILPVMLLISSLWLISLNSFKIAGFILAISISSKLSMLIALPFIIVYIQKRRGIGKELINFSFSLLIFLSLFIIPFLFSKGYWQIVLGTKEIERLYSVYFAFGENLKLFIAPIIYVLSFYLVWRLRRVSQDMFIITTGLGFFATLIFLPPAPGWSMWVLPFLSYYQIRSKKDLFTFGLIYNFLAVVNIIIFSSGADLYLPFIDKNFYLGLESNQYLSENIKNLIFSGQQGLALLLALRMYIYGIGRNNLYNSFSKPVLISISGNQNIQIQNFVKSTRNMFYSEHLKFVKASDYLISTSKINFIKNKKSFSDFKIANNSYFNLHFSKGIQDLNNLIDINTKDYLILLNDLNIKTGVLCEKIDIFININSGKKDNFYPKPINQFSKVYDINFEFKEFNYENKKLKSLITYFPLGFMHDQLLRLLISISSLHVDTEMSKDKEWIKFIIEGDPTREDIEHIARILVPELDDFSLKEKCFESGYVGIMQVILLANISKSLKKINA